MSSRTAGLSVVSVAAIAFLAGCAQTQDGQPVAEPATATSSRQAPVGGSVAATTADEQPCDPAVDLDAPEVFAVIEQLPPPQQIPDATWLRAYNGNYNRCSDLSYAQVGIVGATGSSPTHLLLFHRGEYVGTATPCALNPAVVATAFDSLDVEYTYPREGEPHAAATGFAELTFTWTGGEVVTEGRLPDEYLESTGCDKMR
ncbi:LppP/LprE family lipoprotein [Rhodococcus ruber]|uniref:LppP/LprE family lipoprotein n=1 Tax=Rhodococcus ruber TaxID=1830 RepID=A0A098BHI3_9NOCA|nr:LppP/LprE family lipoprotein [Rhodococcus ruber]MCD2129643.1 LppP/LprE family lipoprotein [Rhodococcus ruber]MCZ4506135.1 LppP/LprE family lipoprotein [Rhodococcus ruber]MCZ4533236.1 LppP/LprE family lipoprotein [Rhodococcus ruber]MCZ4623689.1 LppP/LprE family lipoprotein [Rhodococcus ruber]MDI9970784.1 LppP/LprE family lipoprotein [Rhodococcus ruber]